MGQEDPLRDHLESQFELFQEASRINGFEIVEQMRAEADALDGKREVRYIDFAGYSYTSVPDEGELKAKAILNEAAEQLEQYLNDLGSDGMCSEQELQKFWEESKIFNGADIAQQMRHDAKYAPQNQRTALKETAAKFEQYLNDVGTDGKCSNKDVDQFCKKFLSEDENPYQASEAVRGHMNAYVNETKESINWGELATGALSTFDGLAMLATAFGVTVGTAILAGALAVPIGLMMAPLWVGGVLDIKESVHHIVEALEPSRPNEGHNNTHESDHNHWNNNTNGSNTQSAPNGLCGWDYNPNTGELVDPVCGPRPGGE